MDSEEKQLLQKTFELSEENNKILHKMRRAQQIASFMQVVYWLIIIGVAIGAFYFIQPYIDILIKFIKNTGLNLSQLQGFSLPR